MQKNSLEQPNITKLVRSLVEYGIPADTVEYEKVESYLKEMVEV